MNTNQILIKQPQISQNGDKSRLTADIVINEKTEHMWLEVDKEYEEYLTTERSDAFLIALLPFAMVRNFNIICTAPVTASLLYNLQSQLMPMLSKSTQVKQHNIKITGETTHNIITNIGAVGTGMSMGVDSMHALYNHMPNEGKLIGLTHLLFGNFGNFGKNYKDTNVNVQQHLYKKAKEVADEASLPLVYTNTNIPTFYLQNGITFEFCHSYFMAFTAHGLAKLFKYYLFGSGYTYYQLNLDVVDSAEYDAFSMPLFSTNGLRLFSEGAARDRMEKTQSIMDFTIAQKYLNVCIENENNCGFCFKCARTMLCLDLLGKLEDFSAVFPIEYYRLNYDDYLMWLAKNMMQDKIIEKPIWEAMQKSENAHRFNRTVDLLKARAKKTSTAI